MTIPFIEPYLAPTRDQLPVSKVSWRPDASRAVLLVHDMQRYFLRFYAADRSPIRELLPNVAALRELARVESIPVVYTAQPADPARARRGLLNDMWGPGLTAYPDEQEIAVELTPYAGDLTLEKTRYSAFHGTELLSFMRAQGRDQLWICGVFAHIGCMLTAFDAFMNDVQPFLVADALADFSRQHHDMALELVASRCGVSLDTRALLESAAERKRDLRAWLLGALSELSPLALESLSERDELSAIGIDSVRRMELIERLQAAQLSVAAVDVMESETVGQLLLLLSRTASEPGQGTIRGVS